MLDLAAKIRQGVDLLPPAVAIQPGQGFVLVAGEHRLAAYQQAGRTMLDVYVLRVWDDLVAWLMSDLAAAGRYPAQATGWDYVTAAHFANKALRLVRSDRSDQPMEDLAEYLGLVRAGIDNARWGLAQAANPENAEAVRTFLTAEIALIQAGRAGPHSLRERVKKFKAKQSGSTADPFLQVEAIERILIQLNAAAEAVTQLGMLSDRIDPKRAAELRVAITQSQTPLHQLKVQLQERAKQA